MKRLIVLICMGVLPCSLFAATLETAVNALALPASAPYTANNWSSIDAIAGVRWYKKGLQETPNGSFSRFGQIRLERLGKADIFFSGARTMVSQLDIGISEASGKIFEKEQFTSILKSQFNKNAVIKTLREGCKDEGILSGSAVYEITLPQKKPVYVLVSTDSGGNSPNSRSSSFQFTLRYESRWQCRP